MTSQPRLEVGRKFRPSSAVTSLPVGPLRSATSALARTMWRRQRSCLRRQRPASHPTLRWHLAHRQPAVCWNVLHTDSEPRCMWTACWSGYCRCKANLGAVGEHRGHRSPAGRRREQSTPLRCSDVCSMVPISVFTDANALPR